MVKVPKFNNFFSEKGGKISINTWQKQKNTKSEKYPGMGYMYRNKTWYEKLSFAYLQSFLSMKKMGNSIYGIKANRKNKRRILFVKNAQILSLTMVIFHKKRLHFLLDFV